MSLANLVVERGVVPCLKPKKLLGDVFGSRASSADLSQRKFVALRLDGCPCRSVWKNFTVCERHSNRRDDETKRRPPPPTSGGLRTGVGSHRVNQAHPLAFLSGTLWPCPS